MSHSVRSYFDYSFSAPEDGIGSRFIPINMKHFSRVKHALQYMESWCKIHAKPGEIFALEAVEHYDGFRSEPHLETVLQWDGAQLEPIGYDWYYI